MYKLYDDEDIFSQRFDVIKRENKVYILDVIEQHRSFGSFL